MLFDESQASALKQFLTRELEPLSDADPEVLSDYVFALLKSDASADELKEKCNTELVDFLHDATRPFVDGLFNALSTKSYIASNGSKRRRDISDTGREEIKSMRPPSGPRAMIAPYGEPKLRCRDYDEKGFCMRGDLCPYDHGTDHIIVEEQTHNGITNGYAPPPGVIPEYDPTASSAFPVSMQGDQFGGGRGRGRGRGRGDRARARGRGRGRGASSMQHGHSMGGQNTSLVVENIPPTHLTDEAVHNFFSKFGSINEIKVDPYSKTAIVKFESNPEAYAAYNSPEAIFDNRFVKVFWAKMDMPHSQEQDMQMDGSPPPRRDLIITEAEQARIDAAKAKDEEFKARKQEKLKAMLELQKQKELLIQRQIEEQKALMEKLSDKSLSAKDKDVIKQQLQRLAGGATSTASAPDSSGDVSMNDSASTFANNTEELRAKVEALKAEATAMGLDPTAMQQPSFRGRGRSTYRARPRGSQSWVRGRGTIGTGPRVFKLDNRTSQISIGNVPVDKQQALQSYLSSFGQVDISTSENGKLLAKFSDRAIAEQAIAKGREIPDVGIVDIQWAPMPRHQASTMSFSPTPQFNTDTAGDATFSYEEEEEDDEEQERSWKR